MANSFYIDKMHLLEPAEVIMKQTIGHDQNGDRRWEDNCGRLRDMEFEMKRQQIDDFIESKEGGAIIHEWLINEYADLLTVWMQGIAMGDVESSRDMEQEIRDFVKRYLEDAA